MPRLQRSHPTVSDCLISGGVYFAGRSSGWRAGMAFYDPGAQGQAAARAYLITTEQFVDVLAQETRRSPG